MKETWRKAKGFEGYLYISDQGRVYRKPRTYYDTIKHREIVVGGMVEHSPNHSRAYYRVGAVIDGTKASESVHRLVALTFIPNPHGLPVVNHLNGNKHDNRAVNLEWCTASENQQHAIRTGLRKVRRTRQFVGQYKDGIKVREFVDCRDAGEAMGVSDRKIGKAIRQGTEVSGYTFTRERAEI